jgi:ribosome-binding factor A
MTQQYERTDRVSQKLQEILARLLLTEIQDPRVDGVEITDAEVTPDLKHATIYYMPLQEETSREEIQEGLEHARGYLKREVAERLDTKYVPDLEFEFDETIERARRIETLLDDADTGDDGDET